MGKLLRGGGGVFFVLTIIIDTSVFQNQQYHDDSTASDHSTLFSFLGYLFMFILRKFA
jgi:hypothetical protein